VAPKTLTTDLLDSGVLSFTIESRILRELGERLVKQPEVALLELVKNAYDADSTECELLHEPPGRIVVSDNGHGMTLEEFKNGWMRIGTSAKEGTPKSRDFGRVITGEKGIGRFAVRFLGRALQLESIAFDRARETRTLLTAHFDWPKFDRTEDLGKISVPYELRNADETAQTGTRLQITELRPNAQSIDLKSVRTASLGIVTPFQSLLRRHEAASPSSRSSIPKEQQDPGFRVRIGAAQDEGDDGDLASMVLDSFVLRAVVDLKADRLHLAVYRNGTKKASLEIKDRYESSIGPVYADIRFFPWRKGTFAGLGVDGRRAANWVKDRSGVAVFDRTFRVHPYGMVSDDWLSLSADTARRARDPRSSIAKKHFPMDEETRKSTRLNYMLRLPYPQQLVGIVQVEGGRTQDEATGERGLIPAADREGFLNNESYQHLWDLIRGAVEAIASADRELQREQEREAQRETLRALRKETRAAIREIEANRDIPTVDKSRIISRLAQTELLAQTYDEQSRQREAALEVMSLLGVVAGFMTHEFGVALDELGKAQKQLSKLSRRDAGLKEASEAISGRLDKLKEFVAYSQGYIRGASERPKDPYPVRPRIRQVIRVFGNYASSRNITVELNVERDTMAPLVPVSLYNGIALNLFTNSLKAVTAKLGNDERRIAFRAWNEPRNHVLEVSDTGIGIPTALRNRIFEPLFTTTSSNHGPLGSGMGLGLSLVKRGVEAYGGRVAVTDPPAGYTTCVRVRIPMEEKG
jgi:signal transduction histidine kinase